MKIPRFLGKSIYELEQQFDARKRKVKKRFFKHDPLMVQPYLGYGNRSRIVVRGRVLENEGIAVPNERDSAFKNLRRMLKRVESDEIPDVQLALTCRGAEMRTISDEEGYYKATIEVQMPHDQQLWEEVAIQVMSAPEPYATGLKTLSPVLIPKAAASFGVISDIDDTILQTGAISIYRMVRNTFFKNAFTRMPLTGAADFYKLLFEGKSEDGEPQGNPFFYVSSSPWNIYDFLIQFINKNEIPLGPLFLKDYGINKDSLVSASHEDHKLKIIREIMDFYPHLPFILIGDSGQHDPQIYEQAAQMYPGRVLAVYIHHAHKQKNQKKIDERIASIRQLDIPVFLLDTVDPAIKHAREMGWVK